MKNYEDLIDHPRHISKRHHAMSMRNRAAQFSPFAALTGFDDEIDETARLTESMRELTEDETNALNQMFKKLLESTSKHPLVSVKYFKPDKRKEGGMYETYTGHFRFFDEEERKLKFTDGTVILMQYVYNIDFIKD